MNPVGVALFCAVSLWLARMWIREARENPQGGALPGASSCPWRAVVIAVAGTLILLALETWGEIRLGISEEQKDVSWLALPMFAAAAFTEEVIFRGYLVVERCGNALRWASIILFSLIFALIHDHLWSFEMPEDRSAGTLAAIREGFSLNLSVKGFFSTGFIFVGALWFYFVRFFKWNPKASLLAPVAAHLVKNLAVFFIKLAQGHVTGLL
ncbi:MAG: CPBP family intramembrane metalloprotease [Opitutales bacterium]|nr:CPBP family intramembrane metalloprotease [Opitutales bacterium]MBQ9759636.1 CPBP family intramembrane metalloprotease [Opitutales bacterium]